MVAKVKCPGLIVATPVIRPWNLPKLRESLLPGREHFDLSWAVAMDGARLGTRVGIEPMEGIGDWIFTGVSTVPGNYGERHQNPMLDFMAPGHWFWGLADDNIAHPDFFPELRALIDEYPDKRAFMFRLTRSIGHTIPAHPDKIRPGEVDGVQVVWRRDLAGDLRWADSPTTDGDFLVKLYERDREAWHFHDEELVYYNRLR